MIATQLSSINADQLKIDQSLMKMGFEFADEYLLNEYGVTDIMALNTKDIRDETHSSGQD